MPSKRDYRAAYARRDERARALGYKGYYDYRAHDNGRLPPERARLTGADLARARGHRSLADLVRTLRPGDLVLLEGSKRDPKTGRYLWIDLRVIDYRGHETVFRLHARQITSVKLRQLVEAIQDVGATISPVSSLDLRKVIEEVEEEEVRRAQLEIGVKGGKTITVDLDDDGADHE